MCMTESGLPLDEDFLYTAYLTQDKKCDFCDNFTVKYNEATFDTVRSKLGLTKALQLGKLCKDCGFLILAYTIFEEDIW